jgi:MHS family proline/betaine transporter-like MFS transporter
MTSKITRAQLLSACLGNLFEHYDMALFGFLSPALAPLFFPQQDPVTALILTYAMIPLGMLARPFGSLAFGYIGDKYGREKALSLSLSGMAIVTGCIAFSPTFAQIGMLAPLLLALGRVLQNFLAAGETMGGAIFILENSENKHHDLLSSLYNASTIAGILLASAGISTLYFFDSLESGWRILYAIGCITALFGSLLRRNMMALKNTVITSVTGTKNFIHIFWEYRSSLLLIALASGYSYASYIIALVLMDGFIPLVTIFTKAQMAALNTSLLILDLLALPLFGWLSSKTSRTKMMAYSALAAAVSAIPLFTLLEGSSFTIILLIRMILIFFGVAFFAPFHAWTQQMVPKAHRYLIISFGYALGSQLLGGPTAAISLWFFQKTGSITSIAWYWLALGLISGLAILKSSQSKVRESNVLEELNCCAGERS